MRKRRTTIAALTGAALLLGLGWQTLQQADAYPKKKKKTPTAAAVKRTQKTVRMLDDIYKSTVVLITEHYVNDEDDLPAGTAAKALFAAVKRKGWHEVRLLDIAGKPINEDNVARDNFEKKALAMIKSGKSYYDEVVDKNGVPHLRAVTPIPVVLKKCIMCHENYEDAKKGEAIGALAYTIKIE